MAILTVSEAAKRSGVSTQTILNWGERGMITIKKEVGKDGRKWFHANKEQIDEICSVAQDIGKTKIDNPGIPYHAFHNHGSGQTFSYPDLLGFVRQDNMLSLTALGNNNNQFILLSSGIQSKVHYAEYIRTKAQEALTEIDGVLITLQNIYHQPVFDMIRQMGDKNRRLLEKLVVKKTEECLVGAEKHGIKYLSFKT